MNQCLVLNTANQLYNYMTNDDLCTVSVFIGTYSKCYILCTVSGV